MTGSERTEPRGVALLRSGWVWALGCGRLQRDESLELQLSCLRFEAWASGFRLRDTL